MPSPRAPAITLGEGLPSVLTPAIINTPEARRRYTKPALRIFFMIAEEWELTADQQRGLLGFPSTSTFYNYRNGTSSLLSADTLTRLSLVFGIYKDLKILYPEPRIHRRWVHMPNSNPLFADAPPIGMMAFNGIDALYRVRRFLDARRGVI